MLPLLAILCITAVKDGVEDYRRQQLDEAVNNSAVTRLGDWRNVNVPRYRRGFFAKLFGLRGASSAAINRSAKVSKGVRKLRAKEGDFNADFLYEGGGQQHSSLDLMHSDTSHANFGAQSSALDSTEILQEHGLAPTSVPMGGKDGRSRSHSVSRSLATSHRTLPKTGVVDYDRQAPGTAKWERTLWKKLEVGDIVLLRENDQVPADIVVLSTSDADGQCFVETKNVSDNIPSRRNKLTFNGSARWRDQLETAKSAQSDTGYPARRRRRTCAVRHRLRTSSCESIQLQWCLEIYLQSRWTRSRASYH